MSKAALLNRAVVAGGFLFLCGATGLSLDETRAPGRAAPPPASAALAQPRNPNSKHDFFAGLTLTDDQKTKIDRIREDTMSHLAAVANDKKLSPEVMDAMIQGFRRIEYGQILDVLTGDQQREVRRRMSEWKAAAQQRQQQSQQAPVSERNPQRRETTQH